VGKAADASSPRFESGLSLPFFRSSVDLTINETTSRVDPLMD